MTERVTANLQGAFIVIACVVAGALLAGAGHPPTERTIHLQGRKYAWDPPIIHVNRGDRVTIVLTSKDVTHGFYLDGYDIDASISPDEKPMLHHPSHPNDPAVEVPSIQFVANKEGKFRYRCSRTCGFMHPFMIGELVVAPNRPFTAGMGGAIGVTLAVLLAAIRGGGKRDG